MTPATAHDADTITIAAGPQNARIDAGSGLRFYSWRGRADLMSVTSARTEAGVPHGLVQWQISQVVNRAIDERDEVERMLTRPAKTREKVLEKNRVKEAKSWLRKAATDQRDRDAARGTAVHDLAAQGIVLEDIPEFVEIVDGKVITQVPREEIVPRLSWFIGWLKASGCKILAQEFQVFNLTHGYAGSVDLLVEFANGQIWLIDLKTGAGTYFEHALQVTAYRNAEFVGKDDVVDDHLTDLLHQISATAILHLGIDGWEFVKVRSDSRVFQAYLGVLDFARLSLEIGHNEGYVLARRSFPDLTTAQDAVVASMAAELEARTAA